LRYIFILCLLSAQKKKRCKRLCSYKADLCRASFRLLSAQKTNDERGPARRVGNLVGNQGFTLRVIYENSVKIDLFSLGSLFSHFRPRDIRQGIVPLSILKLFIHIHVTI